jgi:hypothetical protein
MLSNAQKSAGTMPQSLRVAFVDHAASLGFWRKACKELEFNRAMQHTKNCVNKRRVANDAKTIRETTRLQESGAGFHGQINTQGPDQSTGFAAYITLGDSPHEKAIPE